MYNKCTLIFNAEIVSSLINFYIFAGNSAAKLHDKKLESASKQYNKNKNSF